MSERLVDSGSTRWYHFGPQGERRQLTNAGGSVVDSYVTTVYGELVASSGSDPNPFRYGGQFGYWSDSGAPGGAMLCGARWYSASAGRWLSRDPIGYEGGANLYEYCGGDPVGAVDPSGLQAARMVSNPRMTVDTDGCPDADVQAHFLRDSRGRIRRDRRGRPIRDLNWGDPNHSDQTSLSFGGAALNSKVVPYVVYFVHGEGNNLSIRPGDIAIVTYGSRSQAAVFGDAGHSLAGEGSVALHMALGSDPRRMWVSRDGKTRHVCWDRNIEAGTSTMAFPGSAAGFLQWASNATAGNPYTAANLNTYAGLLLFMWTMSRWSAWWR